MALIQKPDPARHGISQVFGKEYTHNTVGIILAQSEIVKHNLAFYHTLVQIHIGCDKLRAIGRKT